MALPKPCLNDFGVYDTLESFDWLFFNHNMSCALIWSVFCLDPLSVGCNFRSVIVPFLTISSPRTLLDLMTGHRRSHTDRRRDSTPIKTGNFANFSVFQKEVSNWLNDTPIYPTFPKKKSILGLSWLHTNSYLFSEIIECDRQSFWHFSAFFLEIFLNALILQQLAHTQSSGWTVIILF